MTGTSDAPEAKLEPIPESIPWHARLAVRLTLFLLVAQLAALWLLPTVYRWSLAALGVPADDTSARDGAALHERTETTHIAERLLHGAERVDEGHWVPTREARLAIERELDSESRGFAWLRADRTIVAISRNQPWSVGDVLQPPFQGEEPELDIQVGSVFVPVHEQGELAGWLVLLHADEARAPSITDMAANAEPREGPVERVEEELRRAEQRRELTASVLAFTVVGLIALYASVLMSRLITRRLSKLARFAASPFEDGPGSAPDALELDGKDEITLVAQAMKTGRDRANTLLAELRQRGEGHRRWVAQVSHDLRTPLTALIASLDRADSTIAQAKAALAPTAADATAVEGDVDAAAFCTNVGDLLHVMRIDAERVNALADDLLDVARLDAGDRPRREPVPPGELVRHAKTEFGPMAQKAEITLTAHSTPGLPILAADGHLVLRALENLLRNALRHARTKVDVSAYRVSDAIRFEVTDDGPGFGAGEGPVGIEQLKDRRERAGSAGLGLVVVQRVAEQHGGRVGVHDAPGGGAVAWFELPVDDDSDVDTQTLIASWTVGRPQR